MFFLCCLSYPQFNTLSSVPLWKYVTWKTLTKGCAEHMYPIWPHTWGVKVLSRFLWGQRSQKVIPYDRWVICKITRECLILLLLYSQTDIIWVKSKKWTFYFPLSSLNSVRSVWPLIFIKHCNRGGALIFSTDQWVAVLRKSIDF